MRGELSPRSRLPVFALVAVLVASLMALLLLLDPAPRADHAPLAPPVAPPPVVYGHAGSPTGSAQPRASARAVAVGRRFLRLYGRVQTQPLDGPAAHRLRELASLALAHTLLAQPPEPAGGGLAPASLARVRVERLSAGAVLMHAAVRRGAALLRVRCLLQRDQGRWTVTALASDR